MKPCIPSRPALLGLAVLAGLHTGCSFAWSSESSSNSIDWSSTATSRTLEWSSDVSSGRTDQDPGYPEDVQEYAAAFATSDGDPRSFQRDVSAIARGYGITDWEREPETYLAIGRGLARSGIRRERCEELSAALTNGDPARLALVRTGYDTLQPR